MTLSLLSSGYRGYHCHFDQSFQVRESGKRIECQWVGPYFGAGCLAFVPARWIVVIFWVISELDRLVDAIVDCSSFVVNWTSCPGAGIPATDSCGCKARTASKNACCAQEGCKYISLCQSLVTPHEFYSARISVVRAPSNRRAWELLYVRHREVNSYPQVSEVKRWRITTMRTRTGRQ